MFSLLGQNQLCTRPGLIKTKLAEISRTISIHMSYLLTTHPVDHILHSGQAYGIFFKRSGHQKCCLVSQFCRHMQKLVNMGFSLNNKKNNKEPRTFAIKKQRVFNCLSLNPPPPQKKQQKQFF